MQYRVLEKTGLKISLIGFGTWGIGGVSLIDSRNVGTSTINEKEAIGMLLFALEEGINLFDTSPSYGNSEKLLGQAFSGRRKNVIIASKIGLTTMRELRYNRKNVEKSIVSTLKNIKSDYIDILQFITPQTYYLDPQEIVFLLSRHVKSGKLRYIGVSLHNFKEGMSLMENQNIDFFQVFYNLFDTRAKEFTEEAKKRGKAIIIKSALNKGILAGHYGRNTIFPSDDVRAAYLNGEVLEKRLGWIDRFLDTFGIKKKELFSYAVNYLRSTGRADSILLGFKNRKHIIHGADICNQKYFSKELVGKIEDFSVNNIDMLDNYFKSVLNFWKEA